MTYDKKNSARAATSDNLALMREAMEALELWAQSGCMMDYDAEGSGTPIGLELIGPAQGGDVYLAAKATTRVLAKLRDEIAREEG